MDKLLRAARGARLKAYAPYSRFKVGAAIEAADGRIFAGCNVENASYGAGCCAERVALHKAVSEGARRFKRIAIAAGTPRPCPPCGICRQALFEFAPGIEVVMAASRGKPLAMPLAALFPMGFAKNGR